MAAEGLPFVERSRTSNSRLAQELATWAERRGRSAIHDAIFRAYFAEDDDIAELSVLLRIAESVGLPKDEARRVLESREESEAVDAAWARVRRMGVTGVPTFVAADIALVGAQPYAALEQWAVEAGAERRTPEL